MLNDRLFSLLRELDADELDHIWKNCLQRDTSDNDFVHGNAEQKIERLSRALRDVASHTIANALRRRSEHEYAWKEILVQIADKLGLAADGSEAALEQMLLQHLSDRADAEKKTATLTDARAASQFALDALTSTSRWRSYWTRR